MTNALTVDATSIPPGRYMTPIVDGLNAYWARITPEHPQVQVETDGEWVPASSAATAAATEQIIASSTMAQATWGRRTGTCAVCTYTVTGDDLRLGGHRICLGDRKDPCKDIRREVHGRLVADLLNAWCVAPQERRIRALVNAGPITLEKLDATTRRVEEGLPAVGMPIPAHVIRDREDPRIPDWAASVAERMGAVAFDRLPQVWHWVAVGELRHQRADLNTAGRVVRLVSKVANVRVASSLLAEAAVLGSVLHASLSCQPHLTLQITALMPLPTEGAPR